MSHQKNLGLDGNSFKHMNIENNNMVTIYCIEDCNSLKYVGSTKNTLKKRLKGHKQNKREKNNTCSSDKLDLDNCKIYSLETCNESNRMEIEKYWINKIDCVNSIKYIGRKESLSRYNASDKNKANQKRYKEKNKEKIKEKRNTQEYKERINIYKKNLYQYKKSWGSIYYGNLLDIDVNLFH